MESELIFVIGESGCGKTTFIERELSPCTLVTIEFFTASELDKITSAVRKQRGSDIVVECNYAGPHDMAFAMSHAGIFKATVFELSLRYGLLRVVKSEAYGTGYFNKGDE